MSWLARRDQEQFTGWIAGLGTDRGHRVVVGHWHRSPYGLVTDSRQDQLFDPVYVRVLGPRRDGDRDPLAEAWQRGVVG
jgi:hypothetical protein